MTENLDKDILENPFRMNEDQFTSDEDIRKNEIQKELAQLIAIRNNLINVIGLDNFIERIKSVIKESNTFKFRSQFAEQVESTSPVFILSLTEETMNIIMKSLEETSSSRKQNLYENKVVDLVQKEIISPAGLILNEFLSEQKELIENFNTNENEDPLKNLFMTNIFGILVSDYSENNIQVRLII